MNKIRMIIGKRVCRFGYKILPHYWKCINCKYIVWKEEEIICWKCGIGEMLYKEWKL